MIWLVSSRLVKYHLLRIFLSDRVFLDRLKKKQYKQINIDDKIQMQPSRRYLRPIDIIINNLIPSSNCLIRSFVKKEVLSNYGIITEVCFGLLKEDNEIRAHAWLSIERNPGYSKVYQVS